MFSVGRGHRISRDVVFVDVPYESQKNRGDRNPNAPLDPEPISLGLAAVRITLFKFHHRCEIDARGIGIEKTVLSAILPHCTSNVFGRIRTRVGRIPDLLITSYVILPDSTGVVHIGASGSLVCQRLPFVVRQTVLEHAPVGERTRFHEKMAVQTTSIRHAVCVLCHSRYSTSKSNVCQQGDYGKKSAR